jgi:hypothetical protein
MVGINIMAAVKQHIEQLAAKEVLEKLGNHIKDSYADVFKLILHIDEMPNKVVCKINLKDSSKTIAMRNYSCPSKFREAWSILIQQHLDAGCIRPSSSAHASPAFLVPKADASNLPPHVNDILADAGCGKIWSKLDMTDSFFHTKMDLESITPPLGCMNGL